VNTSTSFDAADLRALLNGFWNSILEVQTTPQGLLFTMPVSYPDGWQVVLELQRVAPNTWLLSDRGQTLSWLMGHGLNLQTEAMQTHLKRLCNEHSFQMNEGVFFRHIAWPLAADDMHVFAEGVAAISRLDLFNEHRILEEDVARHAVQRILQDAHLPHHRHHKLSITAERSIAIDFYVEQKRPAAIQILKTKTDLAGTMEKWGFRWRELKGLNPGLAPIMLFDRNAQTIDAYSRHIAQTECELFCGFDETDRIHSTLRALQ
jgi:Domain of unknown function DUF1828